MVSGIKFHLFANGGLFVNYFNVILGYISGSMRSQCETSVPVIRRKQFFCHKFRSIFLHHDVLLTHRNAVFPLTRRRELSLLKKLRGVSWLIHIHVDNDLCRSGSRSIASGPFNASREGCSESS